VLPMMPGTPERRSHDYFRHGTTDLFAAFNIAGGTVISELHRHHRAAEFKKFLARIDKAVPAGLDVHLVCGNLATHKAPVIQAWLARDTSMLRLKFIDGRRWDRRRRGTRTRRAVPLFENSNGPWGPTGTNGCQQGTLRPLTNDLARPRSLVLQ
jgi:hypothetical protein